MILLMGEREANPVSGREVFSQRIITKNSAQFVESIAYRKRILTKEDFASSEEQSSIEWELGELRKAYWERKTARAREVFGSNLWGPQEVSKVFNTDLKGEDVAELPDRARMEKAKKLGAVMALRTYGATDVFKEDKRPPKWVMFIPKLLSTDEGKKYDTVNKSYFKQTSAIRDFLDDNELLTDEERKEAPNERLLRWERVVKEFVDKQNETYFQVTDSEVKRIVEALANLKINRKHRHSANDIRYFYMLMYQGNKEAEKKWSFVSGDQGGYEATNTLSGFFWPKGKAYSIAAVGKMLDHRSPPGGEVTAVNILNGQTAAFGDYYPVGARVVI
jgi:hypothetical protein